MASLSLKGIQKIYPNGFHAVKDFNLEIADKEFIIFVGPSGCGKSTTLRMIAGLEDISDGTFKIDGKVMNNVEAKDRDIAMVFQNYALYPHMTVYDNMAFGLKLRKVPKAEIDKKVREAARILDLENFMTVRWDMFSDEVPHSAYQGERNAGVRFSGRNGTGQNGSSQNIFQRRRRTSTYLHKSRRQFP